MGFAFVWFALAAVLILVAVGFEFYRGGFWHGFNKASEWFSPFNISGWIANIVTFLPGIVAFRIAEKVQPRA